MPDTKTKPPDDKTVLKTAKDIAENAVGEEHTPVKDFVPYLVVIDGPRQGTRFQIRDGDNPIGRSVSSVAMLEDASVSRNHSLLVRSGGSWIFKDLGSKNGSFINGQRVKEQVTIGHGDAIQVGIYTLRLIAKPVDSEEEMAQAADGKTSMVHTDGEAKTTEIGGETDTMAATREEAKTSDFGTETNILNETKSSAAVDVPQELPEKKWHPILVYSGMGVAILTVALVGGYSYWKFLRPTKFIKSPKEATTTPQIVQPTLPVVPAAPKTVPVFLDFASSPLPAKVSMDGKDHGLAPVKVNVELEIGKSYTATGTFNLEELQDQRSVQASFDVTKDSTSIPILFKGQIGVIKVLNIPRDTQIYFEGYYAEDPFKPHTSKLPEVVFGKPIYVPYGKYFVELRQPKRVGESNQFVDDIRFKREIHITEDNPVFELSVADEDLQRFPVEIRSIPDNADVLVDGQLVGRTPYKGVFPLGEHVMTLRKEGYFEHTQPLKTDINTLYQVEIPLKTTAAGEFINAGNTLLIKGLHKDAIAQLSEVFKNMPTGREIAQTQYLLGICYLNLGDPATALGYFEQAKGHVDFQYQAMLGLASIYGAQRDIGKALPLLVEVMLKGEEEQLKKDATAVFKQISPLRSVMYIYSDPIGADVVVNDKKIEQKTPLILHDLGLGNYKIRIQKDGFVPQDLNINMSVAEFNPVIIKLKPIEE